jgi:hypothetical protein
VEQSAEENIGAKVEEVTRLEEMSTMRSFTINTLYQITLER